MIVKEIINTIEKNYKSSELVYEKMLEFFFSLSGIGFNTIPMKQNSIIVRARYSGNMASLINLSDITYPPIQYIKNFSRLNRPYQSLFYGSESESACLSEMLPFLIDEYKTGDYIYLTLSKWIVRHDLELLIIPDTNNSNEMNKKVIELLNNEEITFWDYISTKFKMSTKEDKSIYEFTSAFANALWLNSKRQNINLNGFIYSSVQSKLNVNIALSTDTVDDALTPVELAELKFQRTGMNDFNLPIYQETGSRKKGYPNFGKSQIEWS